MRNFATAIFDRRRPPPSRALRRRPASPSRRMAAIRRVGRCCALETEIFTASYPFPDNFTAVPVGISGAGSLSGAGLGENMKWLGRSRAGSASHAWLGLRFRSKIILGFSAVLAVAVVAMGLAYYGFERVGRSLLCKRREAMRSTLDRGCLFRRRRSITVRRGWSGVGGEGSRGPSAFMDSRYSDRGKEPRLGGVRAITRR